MPWILTFFRTLAMGEVLKPLLARVLVFLGMTAVTYTGVGLAWTTIQDQIQTAWAGAGVTTLGYLSLAKIPNAISVILSAYAAKLTLKGLTAAGSLKQVLWKPFQQGSLF